MVVVSRIGSKIAASLAGKSDLYSFRGLSVLPGVKSLLPHPAVAMYYCAGLFVTVPPVPPVPPLLSGSIKVHRLTRIVAVF